MNRPTDRQPGNHITTTHYSRLHRGRRSPLPLSLSLSGVCRVVELHGQPPSTCISIKVKHASIIFPSLSHVGLLLLRWLVLVVVLVLSSLISGEVQPPSMVSDFEKFLQSIVACDTEETRFATLCNLDWIFHTPPFSFDFNSKCAPCVKCLIERRGLAL